MTMMLSFPRKKVLILQVTALIALVLVVYKFAFTEAFLNKPSFIISEDISKDTNHAKDNHDEGEKSATSLDGIELGTDPVRGRNLLIDSYKRQNATIMTLCQEGDLQGVIETVRKLEDRFNKNYHYDWVFLNDVDYSEDFKKQVARFVSGEARFGVIPKEHWSYPSFIDQDKAREERKKMEDEGVIYGGSESYRHMCRFNSGFFYKHPILEEYKYYWRVEPHVDFTCDINYDPFKYMVDNNKIYGFTITIHEFLRTIETLWDTTKEFLDLHKDYLHPNNLVSFISNDKGDTYNLCHFWSNFEIADMDFWRSKEYDAYFEFLDKSGGFFYERWGDAPVHSIAVSLFLDKEKIHFFRDIGYQHGVYQMCPTEDELYNTNRCFCEKKNDFTFDGYACGKEFYKAMGWKKPKDWKKYAD